MSWDWDEGGEWRGGGGGGFGFTIDKRLIIVSVVVLLLVVVTLYSIPGNPVFDYLHRNDKTNVLASLRAISLDMGVYEKAIEVDFNNAMEKKDYATARNVLKQMLFGLKYQTSKYVKILKAIKGDDPEYASIFKLYDDIIETVQLALDGKADPKAALAKIQQLKSEADRLLEKEGKW